MTAARMPTPTPDVATRSYAVTGSRTTAWRRHLPSATEWVAIVLVVAMPLCYGRVWLSLDGDPGRHIRVGETILRSGLFYHDPFSFTKAGAAFVPYEWLSEVLSALSVRIAGLPGLLALAGVVLALTYAIVTRTMLRRGVNPALTAFTLLLLLALGIVHWHARPHIFTLLGAAMLMVLVDRADDRRTPISAREIWSTIWPTALLFAFWTNLHGGFLYGLFVLAAVAVGDRLEMLAATSSDDRDRWQGALIRHAAMFGAALVAGLLNPSGIAVYGHTLGYINDRYLVDHTAEYTSPDFHVLHAAVVVIVLAVWVLATLPRRPRYPTVAIVALNLGFSLLSVRNLPLFGIVVVPLVAAEAQRSIERGWQLPQALRRWAQPASPHAARLHLLWPALAAIAMLGVARRANRADRATSIGAGFDHTALPTTFNPYKFPVRAVRAARAAGLTGRLLSEFMWGGYVLYAWPEQRVFIDGQTDFYGDSIMQEHIALVSVFPGWRATLARRQIELALLSTNSSLADAIAHEPGWQPVYCDSTAIVFRQQASASPALAPLDSLSCGTIAVAPLPVTTAGPDKGRPIAERLASIPNPFHARP